MLVGVDQRDLEAWTQGMYSYEKGKRTKKPFGKDFKPIANIVKSQQIRQAQRSFNPVLQTFTNAQKQSQTQTQQSKNRLDQLNSHYKSTGKHSMRDYDIINLSGSQVIGAQQTQNTTKVRSPIRNIYNPINNEPLPQFYFKGRDVKLAGDKRFRDIKPKGREFDIVTGDYFQDNQGRRESELRKRDLSIQQKYSSTHQNYDPVFGRYYNESKQQEYEQQLSKSQLQQSSGQSYNRRFPPSYLSREPFLLDPTKPPTQSLADLDLKRQHAKQRYKLKYLLQQEYEQRNIEAEEKKEARLRNRVYNSHAMERRGREFGLGLGEIERAREVKIGELYGGVGKVGRLESLYNPESGGAKAGASQVYSESYSSRGSQRSSSVRPSIKSGGFS